MWLACANCCYGTNRLIQKLAFSFIIGLSHLLFLIPQMKLINLSASEDMATTDILEAQVRDARKIVLKLEEARQHSLNSLLVLTLKT